MSAHMGERQRRSQPSTPSWTSFAAFALPSSPKSAHVFSTSGLSTVVHSFVEQQFVHGQEKEAPIVSEQEKLVNIYKPVRAPRKRRKDTAMQPFHPQNMLKSMLSLFQKLPAQKCPTVVLRIVSPHSAVPQIWTGSGADPPGTS